ncbi:MAG: hypothetical protein SV062_13695, partial [Thermodesulfobacteriota bacterium]|nr:hypothetical protein [Thermodesulfobacteriota bacterium]
IDRESFYQIIKNHIDIAVKIIHRLSIRLKDTNQIISSILIKDDFNKLVKSILSFGDEKDNTLKTTLKVLLEKIWNMDKTSLIKYLKKLKETDLINIQGDDLIVSDTNRLKALFNDIKINRHE